MPVIIIKLLKFALIPLVLFVLYLIVVIGLSAIKEYNPGEIISVKNSISEPDTIYPEKEYSILTWNIGYAGLGKEMDFFYEGGKQVKADIELNTTYLQGIRDFITLQNTLDFILLQEVDFYSCRSYKNDQENFISQSVQDYDVFRAINYKSFFVPLPFTRPMGRVESGLVSLTHNTPIEIIRRESTASYPWPKRLFTPKRCFLISSYLTDGNHALHIINIHNSAYDDAGNLREAEMKFIRDFGLAEYKKGNYVVFGGDWNQNPPGIKNQNRKYKIKEVRPIEPRFMPESWYWAYDGSCATNRDVNEPFQQNSTFCSVIDFFLCSPNIEVSTIRVIDLEFENSDHNPVLMKFRLSRLK